MTAMTRHLLVLSLLALASPLPLPSDSLDHGIALDSRQDEGFHQMMVVGAEYLNSERLKSLYRERVRDDDRVFKIDAVADRSDAEHMSGKGATEQEFQDWERMYRSVGNRDALRMMRLVAIGKNVVIEKVDGPKTSREQVSGSDPLLFNAGGRRRRLLEIYWSRPLLSPGQKLQDSLNVTIDLQVDVLPKVADAERIAKELQRRLNYPRIMVFMRTDTWFIDDIWFPLWFPFAPADKPPTFQEYIARGAMTCVGGVGMRCRWSVR